MMEGRREGRTLPAFRLEIGGITIADVCVVSGWRMGKSGINQQIQEDNIKYNVIIHV